MSMNEDAIIQAAPDTLPVQERLAVLAAEIRVLTRMTVENAIAIGQRLNEAKEMVRGAWGDWLQENVRYSQDTAERFMNVANACANSATLRNSGLGVSALCELLALPSTEAREAYVTDSHVVDGVEKHADEMSVRELRRDIADQKRLAEQAVKDKDDALGREKKAQKAYEDEKKRAQAAAGKVKELEAQLKALKEKPHVESDDNAGDGPDIDSIRREAREAAIKDFQVKIAEANKQAQEAEERAEELKKQLAVADPAISRFGALFIEAQELLEKLVDLIASAAPEKRDGLKNAMAAVFNKYGERLHLDGICGAD